MVDSTKNKMLYATFNQDGSCFALSTENGFGIYNSNPFKDNFYRNLNGGIGIIEMLERSNIIALVGGGANPKFDSNTVIIWDDHQGKVINEIKVSWDIKSVKLRKDKIFIVTEHKIFVLSLATLIVIDTIETCENSNGIIAIAQDSSISIIAYPGKEIGCVMVKNYKNEEIILSISSHQAKLSCLSLNCNGSLIATCSEMGTIIRIYNTDNGTLMKEFRRGSESAEIYSISFDCSSSYLACSSNKKKISIFSLRNLNDNSHNNNNRNNDENGIDHDNKSILHKLSFFFKMYLNDNNNEIDTAIAQFKITDDKAICCFGMGLDLFVISSGVQFYHITFDDKQRGKCGILCQKDLFKPNEV